jgi:hypothetical protein
MLFTEVIMMTPQELENTITFLRGELESAPEPTSKVPYPRTKMFTLLLRNLEPDQLQQLFTEIVALRHAASAEADKLAKMYTELRIATSTPSLTAVSVPSSQSCEVRGIPGSSGS